MSTRIWSYPACSTCKRALKWLDGHGIAPEVIHIVDSPPDRALLEDLWRRSGLPLKKLFNTSGQSYRQGDFSARLPRMTDGEALDALAADGKLIKRPVLDAGATVLVGFREEVYGDALT